MFRQSDLIKAFFVVEDAATRESIAADALPTVALYKNGVLDAAVTVTVTSLATGLYLASAAVPGTGYAAGDSVGLVASFLASTVQRRQVVFNDHIVNEDVTVDMTQTVPESNDEGTVGDALNAARAQGFGKWVKDGTNLTLYAPDGVTVVRAFVLYDPDRPTSRT